MLLAPPLLFLMAENVGFQEQHGKSGWIMEREMKGLGWVALVAMGLFLAGCGGGAGETSTAGSTNGGGGASGSVTLSWDPPSTYSDGTPLTVKGYKVFYGPSPYSFTRSVNVGNTLCASIEGLDEGTWYFTVAAYDSVGTESIPATPGVAVNI